MCLICISKNKKKIIINLKNMISKNFKEKIKIK